MEVSLPLWIQASTLASEMQALDVSEAMHKKAGVVLQYIQLRKEEIAAMTEILGGNNTETAIDRLNEIRGKINTVVEGLR